MVRKTGLSSYEEDPVRLRSSRAFEQPWQP